MASVGIDAESLPGDLSLYLSSSAIESLVKSVLYDQTSGPSTGTLGPPALGASWTLSQGRRLTIQARTSIAELGMEPDALPFGLGGNVQVVEFLEDPLALHCELLFSEPKVKFFTAEAGASGWASLQLQVHVCELSLLLPWNTPQNLRLEPWVFSVIPEFIGGAHCLRDLEFAASVRLPVGLVTFPCTTGGLVGHDVESAALGVQLKELADDDPGSLLPYVEIEWSPTSVSPYGVGFEPSLPALASAYLSWLASQSAPAGSGFAFQQLLQNASRYIASQEGLEIQVRVEAPGTAFPPAVQQLQAFSLGSDVLVAELGPQLENPAVPLLERFRLVLRALSAVALKSQWGNLRRALHKALAESSAMDFLGPAEAQPAPVPAHVLVLTPCLKLRRLFDPITKVPTLFLSRLAKSVLNDFQLYGRLSNGYIPTEGLLGSLRQESGLPLYILPSSVNLSIIEAASESVSDRLGLTVVTALSELLFLIRTNADILDVFLKNVSALAGEELQEARNRVRDYLSWSWSLYGLSAWNKTNPYHTLDNFPLSKVSTGVVSTLPELSWLDSAHFAARLDRRWLLSGLSIATIHSMNSILSIINKTVYSASAKSAHDFNIQEPNLDTHYVHTFDRWQSVFTIALGFEIGGPLDVAFWVGYQQLKGWSPKFIIDTAWLGCSEAAFKKVLDDFGADWTDAISIERIREFTLGNPMEGLGWEWGTEPLDATIEISAKALNAAVKQALAVAEVGRAVLLLLLSKGLGDGTAFRDKVKVIVEPQDLLLFAMLATDPEGSESLEAWERLVRVRVVLCMLGHLTQWIQMDAGAREILTKHTSDQAGGCLEMVDGALRNLAEAMTLPHELVGTLHDVAEKLALLFPPNKEVDESDEPFPRCRFGEDLLAEMNASFRRILVESFDTKHSELLSVLMSISGTAAREIARCVTSLHAVALQPNQSPGDKVSDILLAQVSAMCAGVLDSQDVKLRCGRLVLLDEVAQEYTQAVTQAYLSTENSEALFAATERLSALHQVAEELEEILHSIAFSPVATGLVLQPHENSVRSLLFPAGSVYIPQSGAKLAQMLMPRGAFGGAHHVFSVAFAAGVDVRVTVFESTFLADSDCGFKATLQLSADIEGEDWWDELALEFLEFLANIVLFFFNPASAGNFFTDDTLKNFIGVVMCYVTELKVVVETRLVWQHGILDLTTELAPTHGLGHFLALLEEENVLDSLPTESRQLLELAAGGGQVFGPLRGTSIHSTFPRELYAYGQSMIVLIGANIPSGLLAADIVLTYRGYTSLDPSPSIKAVAVRWVSSECLLAVFDGLGFGTSGLDGSWVDLDLYSGGLPACRLPGSSPGGILFSHDPSPPVRFDTKALMGAREDARLHFGARSVWSSDPGHADPAALVAPFWLCTSGRSIESRQSVLSIDPSRHTAFINIWDLGEFSPKLGTQGDWQLKIVLMEHVEEGKVVLPGLYTLPDWSLWIHPAAPASAFGVTFDLKASGLKMADGGFVPLDLENVPSTSSSQEMPEARATWAICRGPGYDCARITVSEVLQYSVEQDLGIDMIGASPLSVSRQAIEVGLLPLEVPTVHPSTPLRLQVHDHPHTASVLLVPLCDRDWNPRTVLYRFYVQDYTGGYVEMAAEGDFLIAVGDQPVKALAVRNSAAHELGPGLELQTFVPPAGISVRCKRSIFNELPDGTLEPTGDTMECDAELHDSVALTNTVPWGGFKWKPAMPVPPARFTQPRLPLPKPKPGRRAA